MEAEVKNTICTSKNIFAKIQDELSKYIFEQRLLYSFTGNNEFIQNVIMTTSEGKQLKEFLESTEHNYIFGAGTWGIGLAKAWNGHFDGFIDNNSQKWGGFTDTGLEIFPPDKVLRNGFNGNIWIGTRLYYDEIKSQLINDYGIDESHIKNIGKVIDEMAVRQYFDLKVLPHVDKEVFLDVGCLDGMTSCRFFKWAGNCEAKTYCFEPDAKNRLKVEKNLASDINDGNASVIPYAAWDRKETLHFQENGNGVSKIADDGITVNASTIDNEIPDTERVTFIKMDIEGAELRALRGAKKTILQNHPKLAISVYHKPEDMITLADEILRIDGGYKFYLRHYSLADGETVLYVL